MIRQKGTRRMGLPVEFPLMDGQGVLVLQDRRKIPDRRKTQCGLEDLKVILAKMSGDQPAI